MNNECGWLSLAGMSPPRGPLKGLEKADWLVVGAGITGLCAAHSLAELHPDARIVILDRQRAAQGASSRNSGFVVGHEQPGLGELIGEKGFAGYRDDSLIAREANGEVRRRIARHGIDCEFSDSGYYFAVRDPHKLERIDERVETLRAVGASAERLEGAALARKLGTGHYQAGIWCGNGNALMQPAKYVKGLLEALPANVTLYENTPITGLERLANRSLRAVGPEGSVEAPRVLVCLNAFTSRIGIRDSGTFAMELSASLTRPLTDAEYQALGGVEPWGVLSTRPLGATVRLTPDRRILMRNTAEYRRHDLSDQQLMARRQRHLAGLQRRFPWLRESDIQYSWTGHLSASRTGQPYFARVEEGLYAAAGCNGSGVTRGTLWGRLLAEMASGGDSPLLRTVLQRAQPGWIPPSPFFDIGASLRMGFEAYRAGTEA